MIGFSFLLEPLPTLGMVHTWTKHERHPKAGVNEGCRPMYLLTDGRAAQWSHYFATARDYNRTGSVVMKKRSQFVQDSLAHQDELGIKARLNQCWLVTIYAHLTLHPATGRTLFGGCADRTASRDRAGSGEEDLIKTFRGNTQSSSISCSCIATAHAQKCLWPTFVVILYILNVREGKLQS